jgi:hypothetical protein
MDLLCSYEHFKSGAFISHPSAKVSSVCHPWPPLLRRVTYLFCVPLLPLPSEWKIKAPDLKCSYEHKRSMNTWYVPFFQSYMQHIHALKRSKSPSSRHQTSELGPLKPSRPCSAWSHLAAATCTRRPNYFREHLDLAGSHANPCMAWLSAAPACGSRTWCVQRSSASGGAMIRCTTSLMSLGCTLSDSLAKSHRDSSCRACSTTTISRIVRHLGAGGDI